MSGPGAGEPGGERDGAHAAAWRDAVAAIAARTDEFAVVPTFVALDDLAGGAAAPQGGGGAEAAAARPHAALASAYLREALDGRAGVTEDDVTLVLHVLGERHFAAGGEVP
jgi:hypothetical protein